jgi:hypothetical protein
MSGERIAPGDVAIRPAIEADLPLVYTDALGDIWEHNIGFTRGMSEFVFRRFHRYVLDDCITRGRLLVACDPEEASVIFGWILFEANVLHYVNVKRRFRHRGVGQALLEATGLGDKFACTHLTFQGKSLIQQYYPKVSYVPYLLESRPQWQSDSIRQSSP